MNCGFADGQRLSDIQSLDGDQLRQAQWESDVHLVSEPTDAQIWAGGAGTVPAAGMGRSELTDQPFPLAQHYGMCMPHVSEPGEAHDSEAVYEVRQTALDSAARSAVVVPGETGAAAMSDSVLKQTPSRGLSGAGEAAARRRHSSSMSMEQCVETAEARPQTRGALGFEETHPGLRSRGSERLPSRGRTNGGQGASAAGGDGAAAAAAAAAALSHVEETLRAEGAEGAAAEPHAPLRDPLPPGVHSVRSSSFARLASLGLAAPRADLPTAVLRLGFI